MQIEAPTVSEYVPFAQEVQLDESIFDAYVPAAQLIADTAPRQTLVTKKVATSRRFCRERNR